MRTDFPFRLYLVISEEACKGKNILKVAEQAILGGVDIIQLREKNLKDAFFIEKALRLKEVTDKYDVPLIINDNATVALKVNAAGIHVGNNDIPPTSLRMDTGFKNKLVGYSIEYLSQLNTKQSLESDYLGVSPVFKTPTKTDTVTEWGLDGIRNIRKVTTKPLVAIGNVNKDNAKAICKAGADCIAVVSAICGADNPQRSAYELKNEIL